MNTEQSNPSPTRQPPLQSLQRWLLKAAQQGDDQAHYSYARNVLRFSGEQTGPVVVQWLQKSAAQGYAEAQHSLGVMLYDGRLVARDNVAAAKWIYLAADQRHVEARRRLKELQLFLSAAEMAEARRQADAFNPAQKPLPAPQK